MRFIGMGIKASERRPGISRAEIASAVERIVAAVVDGHGLIEDNASISMGSRLHDDLGMDEVDLIEILFGAEERFGLTLPDDGIDPSSTVNDIVDLIAERLKEKEARLAPAQDPKEALKDLPVQQQPEIALVGLEQGASAEEVPELE